MAAENVTKEQFDALKEDLTTFREDFKKLVGAMSEKGKAKGGETVESLEKAYADVRDRGVESCRHATEKISEHPYATLAVSFSVGLVVGHMLSARK